MEQNSSETNEAVSENASNEETVTAAPTRRRASRRVTAAAGEAVPAPEAPGAPEVNIETAEKAAPAATRATRGTAAAKSAATATDAQPEASAEEAPAAPKKRVTRSRKKPEVATAQAEEPSADAGRDAAAAASDAAASDSAAAASPAATPAADASEAAGGADSAAPAKKTPVRRSRRTTKAATTAAAKAENSEASSETTAAPEGTAASADTDTAKQSDEAGTAASDSSSAADEETTGARAADQSGEPITGEQAADQGSEQPGEDKPSEAKTEEPAPTRRRTSRSRGRRPSTDTAESAESTSSKPQEQPESNAEAAGTEKDTETQGATGNNGTNGGSGGNTRGGAGANEGQTRSSRTRQRERKRRGQNEDGEPEITEDDVLLPIAGILDVLDNYAFVRTSGYLPGTGDVYVSLGQVKKYGMRKGDAVVGAIRQPREGEGGGRQKYNAIVKVDTINSKPAEENQDRAEFATFTPIHPDARLRLETEPGEATARVIDLFSPIGKGQRGLIVGPHNSGKSTALQQIAKAVAKNQPDAHLMLVLLEERPEEVTTLQREINGEVIASTFDRPAEDHTTVAELAVERAKRLVELGHDVVLLIDSLTSLARSYNLAAPAASRVPAGNLDAAAVFPVKRLLSAAQNIENGGSLTIISTVSAQPESKLDAALLGELEGVANMQLRLNGDASDRRVFPAIDLARSSTRNEALLTSEAEAKIMDQLRRKLHGDSPLLNLEEFLGQLSKTSSNVELLASAQRGQV